MNRCDHSPNEHPIEKDCSNEAEVKMSMFLPHSFQGLGISLRYLWLLPVFTMMLIGYRMRKYMMHNNFNLIKVSDLVLLSLCMDFAIFLFMLSDNGFVFELEYIPDEPRTQVNLFTGHRGFNFYHLLLLMSSMAVPWIKVHNFTPFFWTSLKYFRPFVAFSSKESARSNDEADGSEIKVDSQKKKLVEGKVSKLENNIQSSDEIDQSRNSSNNLKSMGSKISLSYFIEFLLVLNLYNCLFPEFIHTTSLIFLFFGEKLSSALNTLFHGMIIDLLYKRLPRYINVACKSVYSGTNSLVFFVILILFICPWLVFTHQGWLLLLYHVCIQAFSFIAEIYPPWEKLLDEPRNIIARKVWNIMKSKSNSSCFQEGADCSLKEKLFTYSDYVIWLFNVFSNLWLSLVTLLMIFLITLWLLLEIRASRLRRI